MILHPHSDLESSPFELSSENRPQLHYGNEHLEINGEDDPKEIAGHAETKKSRIRHRRRLHVLIIVITIALIAVVLSSSLTPLLKRRRSVLYSPCHGGSYMEELTDCATQIFANCHIASPHQGSVLPPKILVSP